MMISIHGDVHVAMIMAHNEKRQGPKQKTFEVQKKIFFFLPGHAKAEIVFFFFIMYKLWPVKGPDGYPE